ncbi:uncharacterized protein LOC131875322 [Cryptomeria japonica]|uniref:uncharacterized protein LOC131875322 n=1 Tax=Cryptomeria japonica TaxID=3369 RepID=UPI0027D9D698|nr:uncharacterized protein LOC131875322 [Cryptomeria japonica]
MGAEGGNTCTGARGNTETGGRTKIKGDMETVGGRWHGDRVHSLHSSWGQKTKSPLKNAKKEVWWLVWAEEARERRSGGSLVVLRWQRGAPMAAGRQGGWRSRGPGGAAAGERSGPGLSYGWAEWAGAERWLGGGPGGGGYTGNGWRQRRPGRAGGRGVG